MKNDYITIEEYKRYINLFNLDEIEQKEINGIINNVERILKLKSLTPQKTPTKYLKPIMLPSDYKEINKVLNIQREFYVEREVAFKEKELIAQGYTGEELKKNLEKYAEERRKDLGLRSKKKSSNILNDEDDFTIEDFKNLKNNKN